MPAQILIVEDDEGHAELIRRAFADSGEPARLTFVRTLREARARLAESPLDLVITDLRLPDGDGAELIDAERERARYPVVVMTSFGDQQVAVEAMRTGALDYVVKSETTLADMARLAGRALREWNHISERRNAEAALRRSEEHFRSLIENALDLIVVLDDAACVRYLSPSAGRVLGWDPDAMAGRPVLELVHPDDAAQAGQALAAVMADPGRPQFATVRLANREGEWRVFEAIGQAQQAADGGRAIVINARDVTERVRAEDSRRELEGQLRQAQRLETLGTLAGGIAHDFNNILQAVMGCAELARNKIEGESPAIRYLDRSLEVARRGRDIVEQILHFSRQRSNRLRPLDLREVVDEVVKLLRATLPASFVVQERLEASGVVVGDASQLHQVLMNLATNARQAMGDGGTLEISLERLAAEAEERPPGLAPASHLVLSVSDTGPGIPADIRERIFEPFFTTKGVGGGTGLGLAVAHGIVKGHGGTIACESGPEGGATFRVYLVEAREPASRRRTADTPAVASTLRVLFVDDDPHVVFVGRNLLEGLGHVVTTAASGPEALDCFQATPGDFDLVIADEVMPGMTGSTLCREMQRRREGLPVIIASGHGLPASALFSDTDSVAYLRKPFEAADLSRSIGALLAGSRLR